MTRRLALFALPALLAATPALATSSIHCRTARGGPELWLGVADSPDGGIFQARIVNGREEIVTGEGRGAPRVTQGFVNPRRLRLVIVPGRGRGVFATLVAARRGVPYAGTFTWRGRTLPVRCFWDEDDEG
jgi:hypothetical protein